MRVRMHVLTFTAALAAFVVVTSGRSSAQTNDRPASNRVMVVAWQSNGYLVTENGGASWRLVLPSEVDRLPDHLRALLKTGRSTTALASVAFPNPTATSSTIRFTTRTVGSHNLDLYDGRGEHVLSRKADVRVAGIHEELVDLSSLPCGIYYYRIANGEGPVSDGVITIAR